MSMNNEKDILEERMCNEVKLIETKYASSNKEMDIADLQKLDLLYHTLKSKAGYEEKRKMMEYGFDQNQMSGRRGYSGYSSQMSGGYSEGPDYYSGYPYPPRRW